MKLIPLVGRGAGLFVKVDDGDFDTLMTRKWRLNTKGYAVSCTLGSKDVRKQVWMHRVIMEAPFSSQVDHKNRDRLDNQKHNLRLCTGSENRINSGLLQKNTSGYKGVSWSQQWGKWVAAIQKEGKKLVLGGFDSKEEAAKAYDAKARELFGEFAYCNFPK